MSKDTTEKTTVCIWRGSLVPSFYPALQTILSWGDEVEVPASVLETDPDRWENPTIPQED